MVTFNGASGFVIAVCLPFAKFGNSLPRVMEDCEVRDSFGKV